MTRIHKWWDTHPNLFSWALLAVGMVIIVVIAARNVGFKPAQWAALLAATVVLAGLCVWIISWEDHDDGDTPDDESTSGAKAAQAAGGLAPTPDIEQNHTTVERN